MPCYKKLRILRAVLIFSGMLLFFLFPVVVPLWALRRWTRLHLRLLPIAHRLINWSLDVRLQISGRDNFKKALHREKVLYIVNHISWVDIPVIGSVIRGRFIAKSEVDDMGFFGWLANLQETIYILRDNRHDTRNQFDRIKQRLQAGYNIILFPEGTSSTGHSVLSFKSALFAATDADLDTDNQPVTIQPITIAYTHINGVPIRYSESHKVAWVGDVEMFSHLMELVTLGRIDVRLHFHQPVKSTDYSDRKELARDCHAKISDTLHYEMNNRTL